MRAVFKNGKSLSPNAEQALKYVAKVGVMTKDVWLESFCHGKKRWKNWQFKILIDNGLLKKHNCDLGDYYVLGEEGLKIAKILGWSIVDPVTPKQFRHDELVAHSLLQMEQKKICRNWMIEKEIKDKCDNKFLIQDQRDAIKYPDAICEAYMGKSFHLVSIEYERTGKTIPRYRRILWSYNKMNRFSMVLFIVENNVLKKRIKSSLKHLGRVALIEKIGFVDASEWQKNPLTQPLSLLQPKQVSPS
jgi:hypothetical protein